MTVGRLSGAKASNSDVSRSSRSEALRNAAAAGLAKVIRPSGVTRKIASAEWWIRAVSRCAPRYSSIRRARPRSRQRRIATSAMTRLETQIAMKKVSTPINPRSISSPINMACGTLITTSTSASRHRSARSISGTARDRHPGSVEGSEPDHHVACEPHRVEPRARDVRPAQRLPGEGQIGDEHQPDTDGQHRARHGAGSGARTRGGGRTRARGCPRAGRRSSRAWRQPSSSDRSRTAP